MMKLKNKKQAKGTCLCCKIAISENQMSRAKPNIMNFKHFE